ncbi:class I adenylate-forming enzyme family protein [Streptomyces caniscabiei]|nr:class I adenylate-forming enzyme family protein [Streptomyces caniscabiei]MDX2777102.1 class I adenylate-forming enzyme family protein [Streptomyces caniscabiei]
MTITTTFTTTARPARPPADADAPGNLAAHLAALVERRGWAARPAFHQGHRGWSHGEIHDLAARTATVLADHGVRPGDRVLLALPDSVTWVTTFLALARLGAVAVLVNPELTPPELQFMAEDTEAVLWVTGPGLESRFPARVTVPRQGRGELRDQPRTSRTVKTVKQARRLGSDQLTALSATATPRRTTTSSAADSCGSPPTTSPSPSPGCTSPTASATPWSSRSSPAPPQSSPTAVPPPRRSTSSSPGTA